MLDAQREPGADRIRIGYREIAHERLQSTRSLAAYCGQFFFQPVERIGADRIDPPSNGLPTGAISFCLCGPTMVVSVGEVLGAVWIAASSTAAQMAYSSRVPLGPFSLQDAMPLSRAAVDSAGTLAVSTPASGSFTIDGAAQTVTLTRPGQTARYTFSGASAQLLRLNWAGASLSPAGTTYVTVYRPDGFVILIDAFGNGDTGGTDLPSLPTTGTYTILVDPPAASQWAVDLSVVTR